MSFPGHFLAKYLIAPGEIIIDPFRRGVILSFYDCEGLLRSQFGGEAELKPEYLRAATNKPILARMLDNLKG